MKIDDAKELCPGDEVYWNDPDDGACSRYYVIHTIELRCHVGVGDIARIVEQDGSVLECFISELS